MSLKDRLKSKAESDRSPSVNKSIKTVVDPMMDSR